MRVLGATITFLAVGYFLTSCTETSSLQTGYYQYLYDYDSRELHPEFVIYHHQDDSSEVYFRIHSSELLYTRGNSQSPFVAKIGLTTDIYDQNGVLIDTCKMVIHDLADQKKGWLIGSFPIALSEGQWNLKIELTDMAKKLSQQMILSADKSGRYTAQNYLIRKYEQGEPLFTGFASPGQKIEILSARNAGDTTCMLLGLKSEVRLPPPPFSTSSPELPAMTDAVAERFETTSPGVYSFVVDGGNYFFTHDDNGISGVTVRTAGSFYPRVKMVEELQWPLRYITTKSEHEEILRNNYPKKLIDKFWIECAGSKEHARELIHIYYHRVEEANQYFSTYTEGWRTDRGMIHLIFGNPTRIVKREQSEVWQYGEEGTPTMLSFVFHKVNSPFSGNVYILDRDPGYKPYWERMVQTWRSGRVYSE